MWPKTVPKLLFVCFLLTATLLAWGGGNYALACGGGGCSGGSCGRGASNAGGGSSPPTIPVISAPAVSPVLAKEGQYGRNLPGELVRHFRQYLAARHGDPYFGVFTTTGKLHLSYRDGRLPGDIPLQIVRTYDSGSFGALGFSAGWTLNYFKSIQKDVTNSTVTLANSTGSDILFMATRGGGRWMMTYIPPLDEATGITRIEENTSTGVMTLKYDDGSRMLFATKGTVYRPTKVEGPDSDQYVNFTYNNSNLLTKIENNNGAYFDITYLNGMLHRIEGSDGLDWTYWYDVAGRLKNVDRPDGSDLEYDYDLNGRLNSVKDGNDNEWEYTHDALSGKVTEIEDPTGSTVSFMYALGHTYVNDRNGKTLCYDYSQPKGYTTKVTDGEGYYTELSRDLSGNIEWFDDKEDNRWDFDHNLAHQCTEIEDPTGNTIGFEYHLAYPALVTKFTDQRSSDTEYGYDGLCNLTIATDATGNCVECDYNTMSRMTKIIDRRNYEWDYEYGTYGTIIKVTFPDDEYIEYEYDDSGNKTKFTDARGNSWTYDYDELGRLEETTDPLDCATFRYYDDAGNLTRTKDAFDNETYYYYTVLNQVKEIKNDLGKSTYKWYDANGNLTKSRDFRGNDTEYVYDDANRLEETIDADENSTYRYYDKDGRLTKITDARSNDTEFEYDVVGRMIKKTDAVDNEVEYQYDAVGNRTKVIDARDSEMDYEYDVLNRLVKVTDPFDNYTEQEYDANGNQTKVIDKLGNETEYTYDSRNMRTKITDALDNETEFDYDANGNLTTKTMPDETEYTYVYDALNRRTEATDPLEHTSYTYYSSVGTITKRKDAEGNETEYTYDDLYRKTKVTDAEGNETEYQYDDNGNVTKIIDGRDKDFVTYTHNCLNRVTKQTDALSRYSEFTYDAVGNLTSKTDPLGNDTDFTYDAVNRLTKKEYEDHSYAAYRFDANGNMTEASDGTITFEFTYDAENKPTKVRDDTQGLEIEYAYDDNGNLLEIEDTSNNDINYYYDALNRVSDVVNGSTFATIEYATCCSLRTKLTLGNGCYTEYDYDDARRLTKITNKKSNGTVISSWDYAYDDVGNVTSQTDKDSNETSYTYDDIYQLTEVDYPSGSDFGYQYDAVGNRTKMSEFTTQATITTTYTYDNADELTQWTTSTVTMTFTYASDGCLVSKSDGTDTWTYDWDYERRLEAFKENSATLVEYTYNPTGARRSASDSTLGVTNYFHAGLQVLGEYNSNWSLVTSYILGADAMLDRTTDPDTAYYLTRDRLGSTRELVNSSEVIKTRYGYDAWGDPTETQLSGGVSTDYRFRGWYYASTSEHYAGTGLDYEPAIGRTYQKNVSGAPRSAYGSPNPVSPTPLLGGRDWGEFCIGQEDCTGCCQDQYAFCRANCFVVAVRDFFTSVRYDVNRRARVFDVLLREGDPIPGLDSCIDHCEEMWHDCNFYCNTSRPPDRCFKGGDYQLGEDEVCCTTENWDDVYPWAKHLACKAYACCLYCAERRSGHCAGAQKGCDGERAYYPMYVYWCGEEGLGDSHSKDWWEGTCLCIEDEEPVQR